jgi:threonine dehydratase
MKHRVPDTGHIRQRRDAIAAHIVETPVLRMAALEDALGPGTEVHAKLEFLQRTGTFKARGAVSTLLELNASQRSAGVTAVSAGNHAIAVAYAANALGIDAKVVMLRAANPARVRRCRDYGAQVVLADDVHAAFAEAERIRREEGRFLVHPFEGETIALGTGTLGVEICEQVDEFDALIVPIGGGGLCGGLANAVKQLNPGCRIFGVEPEGADTMFRSFAVGKPQSIEKVTTIADSLGAPFALPYSFELCRANVDELVRVSDDALRAAMRFLFRRSKIAVEPACAASTAALRGPLAERLSGQRVVLVMCGSNIDWATFEAYAELDV